MRKWREMRRSTRRRGMTEHEKNEEKHKAERGKKDEKVEINARRSTRIGRGKKDEKMEIN